MKSLIKHKSAFKKRHLYIIFILCTLITVSIATGYSKGFESDSTIYTPNGARIVMYADVPESGTPEDYDAISSFRFAAQNLYQAGYFRGDTAGSTSADIGMGMRYTQNVVNTRIINGDTMFQEAVSISAAKKTANQRYIEGEHIIYRPSVGVKDNQPVYSDKIEAWTTEEYYSNYGAFPNELSKYLITPKTVLSVRDNNAANAPEIPEPVEIATHEIADDEGDGQAESDDENDPNAGEITCAVPNNLVRGEDGYYTFTLELDPTASSKYYRNEVKSLASATKHPVFLYVSLEIKIDEHFFPVSVTTTESYDILIPVLGALTCTGTLTETFSSIGKESAIPDHEFFRSHLTETGDGPIVAVKDASDYLMEAFDPYINGGKNLDLSANVSINGVNLNNLKVSANIDTLDIRAAYSGTYVQYANDRVYLTLNDIKGYLSVEKAKALMQNDTLKALLAGVELPDFNSYIGPDTLNQILGECTVEVIDGTACVRLPFSLGEGDDKITVDAKLYIDDESMTLIRIEGIVGFAGMNVSLSAKPATAAFPKIDDSYKCLDETLDIVPDIIELVSGKVITVNGTADVKVTKNGTPANISVGMDGYVDFTDTKQVKAELTVDYNGIKPTVKYLNDKIYIELGNIRLSAKADELGTLIQSIKSITGMEIPQSLLDLFAAIKPTAIADYLNILQNIEATENGLKVKLMFATVPAEINVKKTASSVKINLSVSTDAIKDTALALNADFALSSADERDIELADSDSYIDAVRLTPTIQSAYDIATNGTVSATAELELDGKKLTASVSVDFSDKNNIKIKLSEPTLPLTVTVIGTTAYIEISGQKYNARLSGSLDDAKALVELFDKYIPENVKPALGMLFSEEAQSVDFVSIINEALTALRSLTLDGDILFAELVYGDISANVTAAADLSEIKILTALNGKDVSVTLNGIAGAASVSTPDGKFINASDFIEAARAVVPLLEAEGLKLKLDAEMFGVNVNGSIAVQFENGIAIHAALDLGDVPVDLYVKDGTAYATVASAAAIKVGLTKPELDELLISLQKALPDIDLSQVEAAIELVFDPSRLLDAHVSALPTDSGFAFECDLSDVGVDAKFTLAADSTDDAVRTTANVEIAGKTFELGIDFETDELDTLNGITIISGGERIAGINITSVDKQTVTVPENKYIDAIGFIDFIKPLRSLVTDAKDAKSLELDLSAYTLDDMNSSFDIAGSIKISLEKPLCIDGAITLFASSADAEKIYITLVDGTLFLKTGNIKLYFDTENDSQRLYAILKTYLPDYLAFELGKLLKQEEGYLPEGISPVLDAVNRLLEMQPDDDWVAALLGGVYGDGSDSVLKTLLGALQLNKNGDDMTIGISLLGMTLNVTPHIDGDELESISAGVNIGSLFVGMTARLAFSDRKLGVSAPTDANEYVSVLDFVEAIDNAVSTVTAVDKDGNIAFEVSSFSFDYTIYEIETTTDELGNTVNVKDDAGRDKPLTDDNGKKVAAQTIKISEKAGEKALKVKFVKHETENELGEIKVSYKLNLEAHIVLDINTLENSSPLTLDLYVINDDEHPDGIVFLDYAEKNGYGERISLDYTSIMQLVAAVMDIMGVNDDTVEMLLGDYRLQIDKTVFESMDIAGIDGLRDMLNGLASAVESGKAALADVKEAWSLVKNAGGVDNLIDSRESIVELVKSGIDKIKSAIAAFASDDEEADTEDETEPAEEKSGAELYKMVVKAVKFSSGDETDDDGNVIDGKSFLRADIDNEIATQTSGTSFVKVTQTNLGDRTVLDRIQVKDLDVNTKLLKTFDMSFQAGTDITVALPNGYNTTQGKKTYSDFANIKHLLFDVMNTANMLEFDIGGINTSDKINIHLKLGADWLANIDITVKYNAKVKIIPVGEDENGKTQYKTAAAIEIYNQKSQLEVLGFGSTVIIPECTTRLYFYDNVLYIQGVRSWQLNKERVVGTVTGVKCIADVWGTKQTRYPNIRSTEYLSNVDCDFEYINAMYTIDELMNTVSNDMSKFLNEFVFYLIPITTQKIAGQDIRQLINDNLAGSSGSSDNSQKTIAQVFKGYTYDGSKHSMTIGLAELAGSSSLSDLHLSITGANDGDDNILDNYISSLHVDTAIAGIITVELDATLRNIGVADNKAYSKGLAPTDVTRQNGKFKANGNTYLLECDNYDRNTLYTLDGLFAELDGKLYTENAALSPVIRRTDSSDAFTWTSTSYDSRYCDNAYKFGDTNGKYYYDTSLEGHGYRYTNEYDTYYIGTNGDGSKYVYRIENGVQIRMEVKSIIQNLLAEVTFDKDGNIVSVANRPNGIQWSRIWQAA